VADPAVACHIRLDPDLPLRPVPCGTAWQWITCGSAFAAIVWLTASVLFSWYSANFGSFNKTYGSLGAVIGFMTWVWLSISVVLIGAKFNAEIEHQTARDTTTGRPKPLGGAARKWLIRSDRHGPDKWVMFALESIPDPFVGQAPQSEAALATVDELEIFMNEYNVSRHAGLPYL
jgi:hypothetical protein